MPSRDSQTVILSRQTILLVTAVGVGLLTLCYVLGVQVGKQSAALRRPAARGAGEDLQELPASIADQLKALESAAGRRPGLQTPPCPARAPPRPPPPARRPSRPRPAGAAPAAGQPWRRPRPGGGARAAPKAGPRRRPDQPPEEGRAGAGHWTLQLVSTPDQAEAQRMVDARPGRPGSRGRDGPDKGLFKVRLIQPGGPGGRGRHRPEAQEPGLQTVRHKDRMNPGPGTAWPSRC